MKDKNFIIFMILSVLVIFAWTILFGPKPKTPKPGEGGLNGSTVTAGTTIATGATATKPPAEKPVREEPETVPGGTSAPADSSTIAEAVNQEKIVKVKTEVYDIELSSLGAAAKSWKLTQYPKQKCYKYKVNIAWPPFESNPECDTTPIDLVDPAFTWPDYPFVSEVRVEDTDHKVHKVYRNSQWEPISGDLDLSDGATYGEVIFAADMTEGGRVRKIFRFGKSSYEVGIRFEVEGEAPSDASADIGFFYYNDPTASNRLKSLNFEGFITYAEKGSAKGRHQVDAKDIIDKQKLKQEGMDWAGVTNDYFLTAVLIDKGDPPIDFIAFYRAKNKEEDKKEAKKSPRTLEGWVKIKPGDQDLQKGLAGKAELYIGPKSREMLLPVRESLQFSIDYGRLGPLVKWLIIGLVWINKLIGNYGISIILLTVVIRMAMFPLTRTGQKSMKQMQKLQPEMKKIREKFPDDKVKQNEEMQAMWKKHNINPAMGCLPMLLQIPVFFAFYKALLISIELRQAPFFWWITDLSARDPLYIWPVLMGVTQLAMQKMTPTQMDSTQAKVMLAMPIVFMYILRDFPSGLLIYWTMSNLVGVAQQLYVNRQPD